MAISMAVSIFSSQKFNDTVEEKRSQAEVISQFTMENYITEELIKNISEVLCVSSSIKVAENRLVETPLHLRYVILRESRKYFDK